ncbi:GNAT family N-acetyltransferase [Desulfovibrio sp. OttesenSCG-928-F20]|nr:GNAT family N-acetyltransferase [Desulfovibrio sp. OttesenSCG-928-M16]MDL2290758.1 GNAT family N-acetyltransferase [Desulfovibrio sp. OttesenSCG-928-F20]
MRIREAKEAEYGRLLEIWEAAVRVTHDFLRDEHIDFYRSRMLGSYFKDVELLVAEIAPGEPEAFMGLLAPVKIVMEGREIDRPAHLAMLFVHPRSHRQGLGRALVEHAAALYGSLATDVNEQNPGALRFYEKCGFILTGRSENDEEGNPFPMLHMLRS